MTPFITGPDGETLFYAHELSCPLTHKLQLHPGFAEKLRDLRLAWARPMGVNSCCRSAEHNRFVGGAPDSFHIWDQPRHEGQQGTLAIDIRVMSGAERWKLSYLAMTHGWSIGTPRGRFVHLDRRDLIGQEPVSFGY